jgi:hypothetical protein
MTSLNANGNGIKTELAPSPPAFRGVFIVNPETIGAKLARPAAPLRTDVSLLHLGQLMLNSGRLQSVRISAAIASAQRAFSFVKECVRKSEESISWIESNARL